MAKPKLRFPEFTNDWEQRKLSDLIIEYKETVDSDCTLPVLTSSKTEGVVLQEEHFGRVQNHDITGYNILPRNYCTYRNRSDGVDFTFNINRCCDKGIISKFYPVFYGNNSDIFFISMVLNYCDEVVREIAYTCTGTGQKVLSFLDLQKMNIRVPSYDEQKKISQYFEQLDNLIALQQREVEALEKQKKAVMQKIFSQEVRFKMDDGSDYPLWQEKELSSVMSVRNEKQVPDESAPLMAFIANKGVCEKGEKYDRSHLVKSVDKEYKLTKYNDFIYSSNNLDIGSIGLNKYGTAVISVVYEIFNFSSEVVPECMNEIIQQQKVMNAILRYRQGCLYGQYKIFPEDFLSIHVAIPCLEEQQKIADLLSEMDNAIDLTKQELEKWKLLKKGLLQQMFV